MNAAIWAAVISIIGGPLIAWFGVVRRASGKIETSEAKELWAESKALREWASRRIDALNTTIIRLEAEIEELERKHRDCQRESSRLRRQVIEMGGTPNA